MNKKGIGFGDLYPAVLTIIIFAIVLGIGIFVLNETATAISSTTITIVKETSTTLLNESGITLQQFGDCGFHDPTITALYNATGADEIPSANYTFTPST